MAMATVNRTRSRAPGAQLRWIAVVFAIAVGAHGLDHARRGIGVMTTEVTVAGTLQFVLAAVTVALVFRGHPLAPPFAIAVGFASAVGFAAAHLVPHWSSFSDSYTGTHVAPHVTAFSWVTAIFEIGADVALGCVGLRTLQERSRYDQ
jgi:hypothetical protein